MTKPENKMLIIQTELTVKWGIFFLFLGSKIPVDVRKPAAMSHSCHHTDDGKQRKLQ